MHIINPSLSKAGAFFARAHFHQQKTKYVPINNPLPFKKPRQAKQKTIQFEKNLWSCEPVVDECTQKLIEAFFIDFYESGINQVKFFATAKVIVLNLFRAYTAGADYWVSLSLNRNSYTLSRYYQSGLNYGHLRHIFKVLRADKQIRFIPGYFDRSRFGNTKFSRSKRTVIRPARLVEELLLKIRPEYIIRHPNQELIELKDSNKRLQDYCESKSTIRMRSVLKAYNNLLKRSFIVLGVIAPEYVDFSDTTIKRVFNNKSWKQGGRFYGGWWLDKIKSNARHDILINGNPTIELDFKALHPFMLYQRQGIHLKIDPYTPCQYDNYSDTKKHRNLAKDLLLICLNASDEGQAINAIEEDIADDKEKDERRYPDSIPNLWELLKNLKAHNASIASHFCKGGGPRLQYFDSVVAERIIKAFTDMERVVLCLHDGFRCESVYGDDLRKLMASSYMEVLDAPYCPVIDKKVRD